MDIWICSITKRKYSCVLPALWYSAGYRNDSPQSLCSPPAQNSPNPPDKTGRKRDSRQKALGLFCIYGAVLGGKAAGQRSREKDKNGLCTRRLLVDEK